MAFTDGRTIQGCVAKLERAKEHRDAIERELTDYFGVKANQPRLGVKYEPETDENVEYVTTMPDYTDLLDRIGVATGDVIHNLRSVLDHLTYQLAVISTKGNVQDEESIQFAICDGPDDFQRKASRYLREIALNERTVIEGVQPYHGEQGLPTLGWSGPYVHPLALLRALSNQDKHRLLIPTVVIPSGSGGASSASVWIHLMAFTSKEAMLRSFPGEPLQLGAVITRSPAMSGRRVRDKVDMDVYVTPGISLAEGRPLIDTLDRIVGAVTYVLGLFEPLFEERSVED